MKVDSNHPTFALVLLALMASLGSCGRIEPEPERCVSARLLPNVVEMITPSGRVLQFSSAIGQMEEDGTITPIPTALDIPYNPWTWLAHDPVSDRMWLLAGAYDSGTAHLYQLSADGQLEWTQDLTAERPVMRGSVLYHADALYLALTLEPFNPPDPVDYIPQKLQLERRDLTGSVLWSRTDIPISSDEPYPYASAELVRVSGNVLAMVAAPPLTDYGPSFPLTVDIETGAVLWSGADEGHDPLRMVVDDDNVYLAWGTWLSEGLSTSTLSVRTPSDGSEMARSEVEWRPGWSPSAYEGDVALAWMGDQLVTVVNTENPGVTIHDKDGSLACQGTLEVAFDSFGPGFGIAGREQMFVNVEVATGDPNAPEYEEALLLIEPLADD